ncbi:MAG: hypothetical protein SXA11_13705 [Cyanobacteriota bacterium]|nr:hypothetical protein [Cyanobacteriota bacterium]
MRLKVNENGLVIPKSLLEGLDEVEVSREGDSVKIKKAIDISIVRGEAVQTLLEEKLRKIRENRKNKKVNPEQIALAEQFRQLRREIQELHKDNPLSEEEIAAEVDAVRRGE